MNSELDKKVEEDIRETWNELRRKVLEDEIEKRSFFPKLKIRNIMLMNEKVHGNHIIQHSFLSSKIVTLVILNDCNDTRRSIPAFFTISLKKWSICCNPSVNSCMALSHSHNH
ncbi:hypothetical protein M0811_10196 [Anaeramoeba ignava]|uniref:Uncharacterized protein n=1 Tax=Anaeramoeba ignava TaxID=1746090 RepID=A0A9Q0RAB8_ANAIG|nr:hypothetical protein M0811_10196 [Anaeramoeba ignava]